MLRSNLLCTAICALSLFIPRIAFSADAPEVTTLLSPSQLKIMVTHNQLVIRSVSSDGQITYDCLCGPTIAPWEVSPYLREALLNTEDQLFMHHKGWDPVGTARAAGQNVWNWARSMLGSGRKPTQGGSTLGMQLCKNRVFSSEQTFERKLSDKWCAEYLDAVMRKDEIIASYLNAAFFGTGKGKKPIYGVANAARAYFGKLPKDLNLLESATLVGMLRAPSRYNRFKNPKDTRELANGIINNMYGNGLISKEVRDKAIQSSYLMGNLYSINFEHRYFADWVISIVKSKTGELSPGMRIPLTMQATTQALQARAFQKGLSEFGVEKDAAAAFVTVSNNGQVLALSGGQSYSSTQFNAAVFGKRPAASTFKAFSYAVALRKGKKGYDRIYNGSRFGEKFPGSLEPPLPGWMTVSDAFALSKNIPALRIQRYAGEKEVIELARNAGLADHFPSGSALALGAVETSPLRLAGSYNIFLNNGIYVEPFGFFGVANSRGEVLHWHAKREKRLIDEKLVLRMHIMLRAVVTKGTGRQANMVADAKGKTGTSDDNKDAWFVGFKERAVTSVWIGENKIKLSGSEAAKVWASIVSSMSK
jgi:penicillin-binding protein 1A